MLKKIASMYLQSAGPSTFRNINSGASNVCPHCGSPVRSSNPPPPPPNGVTPPKSAPSNQPPSVKPSDPYEEFKKALDKFREERFNSYPVFTPSRPSMIPTPQLPTIDFPKLPLPHAQDQLSRSRWMKSLGL